MDELFEKRMKNLLHDEYDNWLDTLELPLYQGLRISPRKQSVAQTQKELAFLEQKSPFAANTWYIHGHHGLHPAHLQGLFYLQEPSASSAVSILDVQNGDTVLDVCAAPGSKSTQILDALGDEGFLLSNEIDPKRAQALLSNMERMGARNFMVTNMDAPTLCDQLPAYFDKVLVDAPCSGEGMMKKHEAAKDGWSIGNVLLCSARQKDILKSAWKALKPGGVLVYSTCTYAPEENEENVAWLLNTFEDAVLLDSSALFGRPGFSIHGLSEEQALKVRRIFPMDQGEGHFIARFTKRDDRADASAAEGQTLQKKGQKKTGRKADRTQPGKLSNALLKEVDAFLKEQLEMDEKGEIGFRYLFSSEAKDGIRVYGMDRPFIGLSKGKVLRQGVWIGTFVKNRFEPAYAFYLSDKTARYSKTKTETDLKQMDDYFHGQQLSQKAPAGYRALCYRGIPYGFGKSSSGRLTNKLPKGLRLGMTSHLEDPDLHSMEAKEEKSDPPGDTSLDKTSKSAAS